MLGKQTLLKKLLQFRKKDKISFHIPGHKGGAGLSARYKNNAFAIDVTEFAETDDLQNPDGILAAAEARAAAAFGAQKSYYLTNGSSIGLHAAILGAAARGDKLLVDRSCHRAVIAAVVMGGLEPVFLTPAFDTERGISLGLSAQEVKRALAEHPDAVGAVITSPTYYGVCSDVKGIADTLHGLNKFLLVDEAHGAHFAFHQELPLTALELGADVCVQSVHKTLPAPGQTALLHIGQNARCSTARIERALRILQTTSPSYLLMAGIDEAVHFMAQNGEKELGRILDRVIHIRTRLGVINKLSCINEADINRPLDLTRLVVNFEKIGLSGTEAAALLKEDYGIYPEMADDKNVVFVITVSNTYKDLDALEKALDEISYMDLSAAPPAPVPPLPAVTLSLLPQRAWEAEQMLIPVREAVGKICAEIVAACPPGAAILVPGQEIGQTAVDYLLAQTDIQYVHVVA